MHYIGLVFVKAPTKEAVAEAMEPFGEGKHWDWYRCGGRWDGWLLGEEEMKRRETHDGFNFDTSNDDSERNACRVSELPKGKTPYFFVVEDEFVPREYYDQYAKNERGGYGILRDTPDYEDRFKAALEKYATDFVVVVDAHN